MPNAHNIGSSVTIAQKRKTSGKSLRLSGSWREFRHEIEEEKSFGLREIQPRLVHLE